VIRVYDDPSLLKAGGWWCPDRDTDSDAVRTRGAAPENQPFPLPAFLDAQFAALRGYWNSLKRGNASTPFADDLSLAALGKLADSVVLIHVFKKPQRFLFEMAAPKVAELHGEKLEDQFADELDTGTPIQYLNAQSSATAESGAPTFYRYEGPDGSAEYKRLMLPFWGDGHVSTILVAFEMKQVG
jgi:hypothetical protein